nr:MICOS complex subunit MIC60 [Qipengyuania seohaensis]
MRPMLLAVGGAFALGAGVAGYIAWRMDAAPASDAEPAQIADNTPAEGGKPSPTPSASESAAAAEAVERVAEQQGGIDQRLAAAEQRLSRLDLQAQAAAGNVARAEGLLIAFATRRAVDKGAELGYLADQLRLRFGDALPNAVNTILTFSREPVTLDQLIFRLEGLAPSLQSGEGKPSLERFADELGSLFTIRRESAPSPQPQQRLERARLFLESGRPDSAVAEVRNLPGAVNAEGWLRDAERYASAQRALDLIETAAVLEPRRLRDGAGNRIEQPSPVEE